MRFLLAFFAIVGAVPAIAADQVDPNAAARAAIALASPHPNSQLEQQARAAIVLACTKNGCPNQCRTDLAACQADAIKAGVPLILFVCTGVCEGHPRGLPKTWIVCRVDTYDADTQPGSSPRIVIATPPAMTPNAPVGSTTMFIKATVPADTRTETVVNMVNPPKPMPSQQTPPGEVQTPGRVWAVVGYQCSNGKCVEVWGWK